MESFVGSKVGEMVDGKVRILATDASILKAAKVHSDKFELGVNPISYHTFEDDGMHFLRVQGEKKLMTIALYKSINKNGNSDTTMFGGNTTCVSDSCSSGGGCKPTPDDYCTKCKPFGPTGPTDDCTRTTVGGSGGDTGLE